MQENGRAVQPEFLAGAARVPLKYPEGFFPHISFRGRYFTGIHDDLYARALYLQSDGMGAVWVAVDLGDVGDQWIESIAGAASVARGQVFLSATHTHASPHASSTWREDVKNVAQGAAFAQLCLESILEAVQTARERARAARMAYGTDVCHINVNRDYKYTGKDRSITAPYIQAPNPGGISDKTVAVLRFESLEGKCIACLVNYAVHSNVTFYQTWTYETGMLISGDIAGSAMRYVEERSDDGAVALFTMAATADQMPRYLANHRVFDKDGNAGWAYYGQEAGFALMDAQATDLGAVVLRCCERMGASDARPEIRVTTAMVTGMGKVKGAGTPVPAGTSGTTYSQQYNEALDAGFQYTPSEPISMPLSLMRIGKVMLVCVSAEIVTSIGLDIKRAIMQDFDGEIVVVTQCNGSFSYIADDEGYCKMTFEAVASHFMPGIGGEIVRGVRVMLGRMVD